MNPMDGFGVLYDLLMIGLIGWVFIYFKFVR